MDAHHIDHWANGGKTKPSLMGLMLIQRYLDLEDARMK
jgi:hypothetical protein